MNVLLIMPGIYYEREKAFSYATPPYSLLALAAAVRKAGHTPKILDFFSFGYDEENYCAELRAFKPNVVGISGMTFHQTMMLKVAQCTKNILPDVPVVIGGNHATIMYEQLLKHPDVDAVFIGESDEVFPQYLASLEKGDRFPAIDGISFRNGGGTHVGRKTLVTDLDQLPFPAWDLCPPDSYKGVPHGFFYSKRPIACIETSRGCPFQCTYCAADVVSGRKWRYMSPARVVEEMIYLKKEFGVREIHILDDNFTLKYDRAMELMELIISKNLDLAISCPNGLHVKTLDAALLKTMRRAGVYNMALGIESGSENTQNRMGKKLDLAMIRERILQVRRAGIYVTGFFIIGMPYETEKDIEQTIDYGLSLRLNAMTVGIFYPIPGTKDYNDLVNAGKIDKNSFDTDSRTWMDGNPPEFYEHLTPEKLRLFKREFAMRFWLRPRVILTALYRALFQMGFGSLLHGVTFFQRFISLPSAKPSK